MDSYGVIQIGDNLLSIPGAFLYTFTLFLGLLLVGRLTDGIPLKYRAFNVLMYWLCFAAIVTWGYVNLGLWFYVKA
jgi:hypothetical protein